MRHKGSGSKRWRLEGSDARLALAVALRLGVATGSYGKLRWLGVVGALRQSRLTVLDCLAAGGWNTRPLNQLG